MYTSLTTSSFHDDKGEVGWGGSGYRPKVMTSFMNSPKIGSRNQARISLSFDSVHYAAFQLVKSVFLFLRQNPDYPSHAVSLLMIFWYKYNVQCMQTPFC